MGSVKYSVLISLQCLGFENHAMFLITVHQLHLIRVQDSDTFSFGIRRHPVALAVAALQQALDAHQVSGSSSAPLQAALKGLRISLSTADAATLAEAMTGQRLTMSATVLHPKR